MNIVAGHGLLLKLPFADGGPCSYDRTFLVINVDTISNKIRLLNVSSIKGKAHKLLYPSNIPLRKYKPPFKFSSFVKLDALYEIDYFSELDTRILHNRMPYDSNELHNIINKFNAYRISNNVSVVSYNQIQVRTVNSI
jgi:hypothetical protein